MRHFFRIRRRPSPHCLPLVPVISPRFGLRRPAFRASRLKPLEADSEPARARVWWLTHILLLCSRAPLTSRFLHCKLSLYSCKMFARLASVVAADEGRSSPPVAYPYQHVRSCNPPLPLLWTRRLALTASFPIPALSEQMRSSHAVVSALVPLLCAPLLRSNMLEPILGVPMRSFARMTHSFGPSWRLRQRHGSRRMLRLA